MASPAIAANPARTIVEMPGSRPPRKIEIAMSGPNSPTAPIAPAARPNGVRSSPASRRIGRIVPRAVEHRAMPMMTASSPGAISQPTPTPTMRLMSQPPMALRPVRPRNTVNSISEPATKKSIARPYCESASMNSDGCAQPSTAGPTTMPSSSSNTTIGTRIQRPSARASSGASTATSGMMSSVGSSSSTHSP